jgi:hypothetical protein
LQAVPNVLVKDQEKHAVKPLQRRALKPNATAWPGALRAQSIPAGGTPDIKFS